MPLSNNVPKKLVNLEMTVVEVEFFKILDGQKWLLSQRTLNLL